MYVFIQYVGGGGNPPLCNGLKGNRRDSDPGRKAAAWARGACPRGT